MAMTYLKRYRKWFYILIGFVVIVAALRLYFRLPTIRDHDLLYEECRILYSEKYMNGEGEGPVDRSLWPKSISELGPDKVFLYTNSVYLCFKSDYTRRYAVFIDDNVPPDLSQGRYKGVFQKTKHPRIYVYNLVD